MLNVLYTILSFVFLINCLLCDSAAADDHPFRGSEAVAEKLIEDTLQQLSIKYDSDKNDKKMADKIEARVKGLGFKSITELGAVKAQCGLPDAFLIYFVPLDELREYNPAEDPRLLLGRSDAVICPIVVLEKEKMQVRSSATIVVYRDERTTETELELAQVGASTPIPIRLLIQARDNLLKEQKINSCKCFVVYTATDRGFLGDETSGTFVFKILVDGPGKMKKGDLLPAKQVFTELSKEAKGKVYDLPSKPQP